jgi:type IV secretory pathway VirB2 component (pilin)
MEGTMSARPSFLLSVALLFVPALAFAIPGDGPMVGFAQGVVEFLTATLGPIIFAIGLAVAAISLVFGSREGLQKAFFAVVGGGLLFSVGSVVDFVRHMAH